MLACRAADATQASVCATGGDATSSYHPSVAGHLPPRRDDAGYALMVTSLSRPDAKDPTLAWVEDPLVASRSELVAKRRAEAARDLVASAEQPHRPDAEQRRRQRIEEAVAYLSPLPGPNGLQHFLLPQTMQAIGFESLRKKNCLGSLRRYP